MMMMMMMVMVMMMIMIICVCDNEWVKENCTNIIYVSNQLISKLLQHSNINMIECCSTITTTIKYYKYYTNHQYSRNYRIVKNNE